VILYFFGKNTYKVRNAQNVSNECAAKLQSELKDRPIGLFVVFGNIHGNSNFQFLTRICDALPFPHKISFFSNSPSEQNSSLCGFIKVEEFGLCGIEPAFYLVDNKGFIKGFPLTATYLDTLIIDTKVLLRQ